jgi:hypothetical protein
MKISAKDIYKWPIPWISQGKDANDLPELLTANVKYRTNGPIE